MWQSGASLLRLGRPPAAAAPGRHGIGKPFMIAQAAVRPAAGAAGYVAGATLFMDGGMTPYPGFATGG